MKMKGKIIGFSMVGLFLLFSILTIIGGNSFEIIKGHRLPLSSDYNIDQEQTVWKFGYQISNHAKVAQSFTPSLTPLAKVDLFVIKSEIYDVITAPLELGIKITLDGEYISTCSVPASEIPSFYDPDFDDLIESNFEWIEFDFPDIDVEIGETYYIITEQSNYDNGEVYLWGFSYRTEDDLYPRGIPWFNNFNTSWNRFDDFSSHKYCDFCFKTYGYNASSFIEIESINGGFRVRADIRNIGTASAFDISWSIDLDGGLILLGGHDSDIISELDAGESKTIRLSSLFGIGPTTITVTIGDVSKQSSGFILGPLVLNVREI